MKYIRLTLSRWFCLSGLNTLAAETLFFCFIIPHPLLSRDLKSWVLFLKNVLEESERGMRVILHILTAGEDMAVECLALRFLHHKKDSDVVRVEITLWNPNVLL